MRRVLPFQTHNATLLVSVQVVRLILLSRENTAISAHIHLMRFQWTDQAQLVSAFHGTARSVYHFLLLCFFVILYYIINFLQNQLRLLNQ